jgi:hypothetical protein
MKKLLLLAFFAFTMNAFGQPNTYMHVGDSINTLSSFNIGAFPLIPCLSQPPYYYELGLTIGPAISNPPTGLRWILVIDSVNVTIPDSAYTWEAGPMHAGDTLEFASHANSFHIHIATDGDVGFSYGLIGVPTVAGESYCTDYSFSQTGINFCNSELTYGDSCLSTAVVLDTISSVIEMYNAGSGYQSGYLINNAWAEVGGGCSGWGNMTGPSVMVAVIDSCKQPWNNLCVDHGNWNLYGTFPCADTFVCRMRPENYFVYSFYDTASFTHLHAWMRDSVPDGNYILIYSWTTYSWSQVPVELNNLMNNLGCASWPPADSVPFIFAVRKGVTSELDTLVQGSTPNDTIILDIIVNNLCAVGIEEHAENDDAFIFPNPAHNSFAIHQQGDLNIYDVTGRLVKAQKIIDETIIDCRSFSKGIYFVCIRQKEKMLTQKLVIE